MRSNLSLGVLAGLAIVMVMALTPLTRKQEKAPPTPTEREILAKIKEHQADTDALTDLLVRYSIETREAIEQASPDGELPTYKPWLTAIPADLPINAHEGLPRMTWGESTWWPGITAPRLIPADEPRLHGIWYGYLHPTKAYEPTLWFINAYNLFGEIHDLEVWRVGDFENGREGHFAYVRCVPTLDMAIRRCRAFGIGGQAIQREWRRTETDIPESLWGGGGGTFTVEDCEFRETGCINYGSAPRASWAMCLYNTMQHTIVRDVTVVNYWSIPPHEGALLVGYGQSGFRTPDLLVEDCTFWCRQGDRSLVFLQACDSVVFRNVILRGDQAYIDIVDDCGSFTIEEYPDGRDTLVRIKDQWHPFNAPTETRICPDGQTTTITFPPAPETAIARFVPAPAPFTGCYVPSPN